MEILKIASLVALLSLLQSVFAYQGTVAYLREGAITIQNPANAQYMYDELKGQPREYIFTLPAATDASFAVLVPQSSNYQGRYSIEVTSVNETTGYEAQIALLDASQFSWTELYDSLLRQHYLAGTAFSQRLEAGNYKIKIFSSDNQGKYTLKIDGNKQYSVGFLYAYWQTPLLTVQFFNTSPMQLLLTPFALVAVGLAGILVILLLFIFYLAGVWQEYVKHQQAKTMLLTSNGMDMKDEIVKLLQKPAYDVSVAFIVTASKPVEDKSYVEQDLAIMKDIGFNVQQIDIEGKTETEVRQLLELKDIIFVEGGNTFYLLSAMRKCNFEKIIRKLLQQGTVYIGASAGSIVAGKTIRLAEALDENITGLKNLKGLTLVPFDVFVHYQPTNAELIKKNIKNVKKRQKQLKILTDGQALLVQGKETYLIGKGEEIIV